MPRQANEGLDAVIQPGVDELAQALGFEGDLMGEIGLLVGDHGAIEAERGGQGAHADQKRHPGRSAHFDGDAVPPGEPDQGRTHRGDGVPPCVLRVARTLPW